MVSQIEWPIFSATTANDRSLIYRDSGIGRKITHAPFYTSNVYMCVSVSVLHIYVVAICTASSGTLAKLWKLFRGIGNCQRSLFLRAAQSAIYDAFPLAQRWSSLYWIYSCVRRLRVSRTVCKIYKPRRPTMSCVRRFVIVFSCVY